MKKLISITVGIAVAMSMVYFIFSKIRIELVEAATTVNGIYNASTDFSSDQGYRGWYYLNGNGEELSWDAVANQWQGTEQYQLIWQDGAHPGNNVGSGATVVRRWQSPVNGSVRIIGNTHDNNGGCGDGVIISIKKNTSILYQKTIANKNTTGFYFDFDAPTAVGDNFDFIVSRRTQNNNCDSTYFDPYIVPVTDQPLCDDCLQFKVGPAVRVLGPVGVPVDSPFVAFNSGGQITGYSANAKTFKLQGSDMENLVLNSKALLGKGSGTNFDNCGVWLQSIAFTDNIIRGWYHAEKDCNYAAGQTHKSVGYVQSTNGGQSWSKTNYPNNVVLQGSVPQQPNLNTGAGDQTVVRWKDYLYMYFMDLGNWHTGVARAPVSSGGTPGSWWKWFNGGFNAPGLSPDVTTIGYLGMSASHNALYDALSLIVADPWFKGLRLSNSKDATTFTSIDEPLLYFDQHDWARDPQDGELIAYPSIVTPTGNSWVNSFYLFYTYLQPGEDFYKRYLVYRKVDVATTANPEEPQVRVELNNYYSSGNLDNWATNTMVTSDFILTQKLGYTFTKERPDTTALYDCNIPSWSDHMIGVGTDPCGAGSTNLRNLGWIWTVQKPNTLPLYRCMDWTNTDHFLSTDPSCNSQGQTEFILGYIEQ